MTVRRIDAWTLLLASSLTVMAGAIVAPSLPQMAADFSATPRVELLTKLVLTMPALAIVVCGPGVGWLVDRLGRKPMLIAGLVLFAAAGTTGAWLSSLPAILVGRFALGVGVAAIMTSATTLVTDLFSGAQRQRFLGRQAACMGLGAMAFLLTGGALADVSWRAPFLLYAVALLLALPAHRLPEPQSTQHIVDDSPALLDRPTTAALLGLALLGMLLFYLVPVQLPFYLQRSYGAGGLAIGAAIATVTVSSSAASLLFPRVAARLGAHGTLAATFMLAGLGFVGIGLATNAPMLAAALLTAGTGFGLLMPALSTRLAMMAPRHLRGRLMGALTTSFFAGQFLSPIAAGPLVARVGLGGATGLYGCAGMAAIALGAGLGWRGRRRSAAARLSHVTAIRKG